MSIYMKRPYDGFLGQIKAAQNEVKKLPGWMKESAKVATLTFPTTKSTAIGFPAGHGAKRCLTKSQISR